MTIIRQLELETITFIVIIAGLASSYFVWIYYQDKRPLHITVPISNNIPFSQKIITPAMVTPSESPVLGIATASQISPDGTKNLIMKTTHNNNTTQTYEFKTSDISGSNEKQIYTATVNNNESMSIPFNAWSPDDKYVFIIKDGNDALVFSASGGPIAIGQTYIDVTGVFGEKIQQYAYSQTTGWASPTLLIINTTKIDNTQGSSYWFEVPGKAVIQLSAQF